MKKKRQKQTQNQTKPPTEIPAKIDKFLSLAIIIWWVSVCMLAENYGRTTVNS